MKDGDEFADSSPRKLPYWLLILLLTALHFGSASLDHLLISGGRRAILVIPESGLDLVAVVLFGPRCWPILLPAYFATALWLHIPWVPSLGIAVTSVLQCLAAGCLFRQIAGMKRILGEFVDLVGILAAGTLTPAISTGLGTLCLALGRGLPVGPWGTVLNRWWIAETLGIVTLAPVLLTLARLWTAQSMTVRALQLIKLLFYILCVSAISYYIFFQSRTSGVLFAVFALIVIAAAWLGPAAARISALTVALIAIWATHSGVGAFIGAGLRTDLQNLDLFLGAASLTGVVLGAFRSAGNLRLSGSVLLAGLALGGWLYGSLDQDRVSYDEARFDKVITSVETRINGRFNTYEDALWGAAGFVAASHKVGPADWHIYVNRIGLLERYPGTSSLSIIQPVPDEDLDTFVQVHRRAEWPDFTVRPSSSLGAAPELIREHFLIVCAEPASIAVRAVGGDLVGDPVRRAAAEQSRDSGAAVLTRSTVLGGGAGKGLQLFVPVYREGAPLTSTSERRQALIAWVTVVFRAEPFLRSALAELVPDLGLRAYDGNQPLPDQQFFSSGTVRGRTPQSERMTHLILGGNTWTLTWSRLPGFPFLSRAPSAWAAGCTALLSLLSASLVMTLQSTKRRAAALAAEQTAELQTSEARKTAIMHSALDCIITMDAYGCVTEFNPAAEETFGYSRDEVLGRELAELIIPPEIREAHRRGLAHLLATGEGPVLGKRIEVMAMRADGSGFPAELAINRVNYQGSPIFTAYLRDLTDRKRTEEQLLVLSSAIEQSPVSILITDLDGNIEYVNSRLTESTGYTLADLKGKRPGVLLSDDTRTDHFREVNTALQTGAWHGVMHSRKKNGELFWESVSIRSIRDSSGKATHRVAVAEDITQRLEMQRQITQLAAIVEAADAAIISQDLSDRVITWNHGSEKIYGYSSGEVVGRTMYTMIPQDRLEEYAAIKEKVRHGESVDHLETTRITKSGESIHVLLSISPIRDHNGSIIGVATVAWDITNIKRLQSQLAQAQKLESVGQLAAGVAHEINTPIQYIGDNGKFLEDAFRDLIKFARNHNRDSRLAGPGTEHSGVDESVVEEGMLEYLSTEVPNAIRQLIEGVDQVARIVRAMKEFSHPGPIEKAAVDINRAIESTVIVSKNEWKYVAELTMDLDPDLPPVACVAGEFNQVILNLIVNAAHAISDMVKNSGSKGTIHISTRQLESNVEIRVSDTGGGIPDAIRQRVFDPFFTTKPVGKGTGQGLAIAHSVIVQKHGGSLTFESVPDVGTTFIIQLPAARQLEPA